MKCQHVTWIVVVLSTVAAPVDAGPIFNAFYAGALTSRLDWSSDLGVDLINTLPSAPGNGLPRTVSAAAMRDGRPISATITETAPYVLADQYWAGAWTGTLSIPGPGLYGLAANANASGNWTFAVPGQTSAQDASTVFYYASQWTVTAPADIHPQFGVQFIPGPGLSGEATGSFTLGNLGSFGLAGFPAQPSFTALTASLDTNSPGVMNFRYQIAFSTTPITPDVFAAPPTAAPEPATLSLVAVGAAAALVRRRRVQRRG